MYNIICSLLIWQCNVQTEADVMVHSPQATIFARIYVTNCINLFLQKLQLEEERQFFFRSDWQRTEASTGLFSSEELFQF